MAGYEIFHLMIPTSSTRPIPVWSSLSVLRSQDAAGVFGYLAERLVPRLETPHPIDLSPDCCGMLATLCLAQASSHLLSHLHRMQYPCFSLHLVL